MEPPRPTVPSDAVTRRGLRKPVGGKCLGLCSASCTTLLEVLLFCSTQFLSLLSAELDFADGDAHVLVVLHYNNILRLIENMSLQFLSF
jgi:hypothetical protein